MTFLHKLAHRLALLKAILVAAVGASLACELPMRVAVSGSVTRVQLSPRNITLLTNQTTQLVAVGLTAAGDTAAVTMRWSVTGGVIVDTGSTGGRHWLTYRSPAQTGQYKVITQASTVSTLADSATINVSAVPVASVLVSPPTAGVLTGQTVQLTATPRDSAGGALAGRAVTWASNALGVATVSTSGLVSGQTVGSATITATSEGRSGSSSVSVTATTGAPGTVSDLAVTATTDSSATLAFTEVTDGTGVPASYVVRDAVSPITWGTAPDVSRGSCATPVAGSTVGAQRSCTILGLIPATRYDFQVVAFRGTLNVNAVFGNQSNVATATTGSGSTLPVAMVTVAPSVATVVVGGSQQFTATLKDANGNTLSGRVVTWASNAPGVATVSTAGLASGVTAGSATITATSEGQSGSAAVTVITGSGNPPLNEPPGFVAINTQPWDVMLSNSWNYLRRSGSKDDDIVTDPTAPRSPSNVLRIIFTTDMVPNTEPGVHFIGTGETELYAVSWIKWSSNWWMSGHGKINFLFLNGNLGQVYAALFDNGNGLTIAMLPEWAPYTANDAMYPNVTTTNITFGVWHRVEYYFKLPSVPGTTADGVIRWWVDGVLQGDYRNVRAPAGATEFGEYQFAPTILGGPPPAEQYMYVDHTYLSRHP